MSKAAELAALIGSQTALSNRNLVINGAMQVWQRGTSTDTISNGGYLCDRWRINHSGTDGNVDVDRSTDVPAGKGFGFSQKISMDASESSLDSGDQIRVIQRIEGQNLQSLKKGTSSAESVTISFYVKSSVAATYTVNIRDEDNDRDNSKTYTIDSANTWEFKSITFTGDTTGALDNDNGRSFDLNFWIDAGTGFTSGTFYNGTWAAGDNTKKVSATTGWLESTSPEWYITGVQMEVGEQATPFEHRSFGDELARCQRYYYRIASGQYAFFAMGKVLGQIPVAPIVFPTAMRSTPSMTSSNVAMWYNNAGNVTGVNTPTVIYGSGQNEITTVDIRFADNSTVNGNSDPIAFAFDPAGYIDFSAEL
jgi:hypothetical protein